jgi:hypothetical protein
MTAVTDLLALQAEYIAWHESLPNNLGDSATAEAHAIADIDLDTRLRQSCHPVTMDAIEVQRAGRQNAHDRAGQRNPT